MLALNVKVVRVGMRRATNRRPMNPPENFLTMQPATKLATKLLPAKLLLSCAAAALVSACSTPCDAPGRLCAPMSSITSVSPPAPKPALLPAPPPHVSELPPPAPVQTYAIDMGGASVESATELPQHQVRIALLLPLRSEALGPAAEALKAGFMAGYERDHDNFTVDVVETGDVAQDVLASYAAAEEQHDIVVGPLARSAVTAVAGSALVNKPTIALNSPEGRADQPLPPAMLVMGLSIEEEARQTAQWAAAEQPHAGALIVSGGTPWQHRIAAAYAAQWQRLGLPVRSVELGALNGELGAADLAQLNASLQNQPADVVFAALGAGEARQLRIALGSVLPMYGTSALNPGGDPVSQLDGVRLVDLPWQLQRDHPAVMVYPRPLPDQPRKPGAADMERLYALGIDAFRVAREIGRSRAGQFNVDGVTGKLNVSFGQGPSSFERIEQAAVYQNGVAQPMLAPESLPGSPPGSQPMRQPATPPASP